LVERSSAECLHDLGRWFEASVVVHALRQVEPVAGVELVRPRKAHRAKSSRNYDIN